MKKIITGIAIIGYLYTEYKRFNIVLNLDKKNKELIKNNKELNRNNNFLRSLKNIDKDKINDLINENKDLFNQNLIFRKELNILGINGLKNNIKNNLKKHGKYRNN